VAVGEGELDALGGGADVRADDSAAGTEAAVTGELDAAGTAAAAFAVPPWPGSTVIMTTAVAAATTRSEIAPVIIPVRKLTSSSRALMAARKPGRAPAVP